MVSSSSITNNITNKFFLRKKSLLHVIKGNFGAVILFIFFGICKYSICETASIGIVVFYNRYSLILLLGHNSRVFWTVPTRQSRNLQNSHETLSVGHLYMRVYWGWRYRAKSISHFSKFSFKDFEL